MSIFTTTHRRNLALATGIVAVALVAAAFSAATGTSAALAQTAAPQTGPAMPANQLMPLPGEVRLSLKLGERLVAFPAKLNPIARETIPFEVSGHAITAEGRQAMIKLQEELFRQPGGSLVIVVYGEDEQLAFQRAKAVRGELAERHSMDLGRMVATGRKAQGHQGDTAVVDVFSADPTRCDGCNGTSFRTIALDSATLQLVTVTPETLPQQPQAAPKQLADTPTPAARPQPTQAQRRSEPPAPARLEAKAAPLAAPLPAKPASQQVAPARSASITTGGCPRPRIIIDDYYPGGPMVPCRPQR